MSIVPTMIQTERGPWPGPRPYRESDRRSFFGREDERYDVLDRLDAERLVLLTAPTGVGKTSFLRACVVPQLRQFRQRSLQAGQVPRQSPVVVVRDWTIPGLTTTDQFFVEALGEGIELLLREAPSYDDAGARCIRDDYELLKATGERLGTENAYDYIAGLAREIGGLTLVLDQFEEALQGDVRHRNGVAQLIGRLFEREPDVRMILSFRQEYWIRFRILSKYIGDLSKRTYDLPAISEETLREALLESARVGGVELAEDALDELLAWMDPSRGTTGDRAPSSKRQPGIRRTSQYVGTADSTIDLLSLQALLLQLYELAAKHRHEDGHLSISLKTLSELRADMASSDDVTDGPAIVESALRRFIDSLLPLPNGVLDSSGLPPTARLDDDQERSLRMRRAAARLAPNLSSGGFKVQQEQSALLARAWREEWEVLDIEVEEVEDALRKAEEALKDADDVEHRIGGLFHGLLVDSRVDSDAPEDVSLLSGIAKRGWTIRAAAVDLVHVSLETLEVLREGNVLRRKALRGHITYELVHDGFGDVLASWAEEARMQPLDALTATTAERGTAFRWHRLTGVVKDASWRGCWIGPDPDRGKRLTVEHVTFENCDLRGTVFDRCDFRRGAFRNCNLSGVVFWDCTFEGLPDDPYAFDGIAASGLNFDDYSSLRHVQFVGQSRLHNMSWNRLAVEDVALSECAINQMTVGEVTLEGQLALRQSWVLLSDLVGLSAAGASVDSRLEIQDCDLFYCRLDESSAQAVDRDATNRRFPDPKAVGSEPALRNAPSDMDPWRQPT